MTNFLLCNAKDVFLTNMHYNANKHTRTIDIKPGAIDIKPGATCLNVP